VFLIARDLFGTGTGLMCLLMFAWFEQKYLLQYSDLLLTENLAYPLVAAALFLLFRYVRTGSWLLLGLGALTLGLAANTRSTLLPIALAPLIFLAFRRRWRPAAVFIAVFALALSVVVVRNYLVSRQLAYLPTYGSINLLIAHSPPSDFHAPPAPANADPNTWVVQQYFSQRPGEFVAQTVRQSLPILGLPSEWSWAKLPDDLGLFLLWPLALIGTAGALKKGHPVEIATLVALVLLQVASATVFGLLAYGIRLALLAYVPLFPLAARGLSMLVRDQRIAFGALGAGLVAGFFLPAPPAPSTASGTFTPVSGDLMAAPLSMPAEAHPGQAFDLALAWQASRLPHAAYTVSIHGLVDRTNQQVFVADASPTAVPPDHTRWDTTQATATWPPGLTITDVHHLTLPAGAPSGLYRLEVGLYSGRPTLAVEPNHLTIPLRVTDPSITAPAQVLGDFGAIRLRDIRRGASSVTLVWTAERAIATDYTAFIHVLDQAGKVVAQNDSQPANQAWPTSAWQPGQVIVDSHDLSIPGDGARLEIGLYTLADGKRLALSDGHDSLIVPVPGV
jgi:hypothetical protein